MDAANEESLAEKLQALDEFTEALKKRLTAGQEVYGDGYLERDCLGESIEECLDLFLWPFLHYLKLRRLKLSACADCPYKKAFEAQEWRECRESDDG